MENKKTEPKTMGVGRGGEGTVNMEGEEVSRTHKLRKLEGEILQGMLQEFREDFKCVVGKWMRLKKSERTQARLLKMVEENFAMDLLADAAWFRAVYHTDRDEFNRFKTETQQNAAMKNDRILQLQEDLRKQQEHSDFLVESATRCNIREEIYLRIIASHFAVPFDPNKGLASPRKWDKGRQALENARLPGLSYLKTEVKF